MKITDELLYAHAAAGQALWLSTLPDPAELDPFVPSRWFQRKMKKLLRQCRRTPRVNAAIRYTKRVALAALVSAVVIFSSLMTVASFRAKVVEVITEVFDTLTSYIFRPGEAESAPLSEVEFGWLPEGMVETEHDETKGIFYYTKFVNKDNPSIFLESFQMEITPDSSIRNIGDSESGTTESIFVNEWAIELIEKSGMYTLSWATDESTITIYSNLSRSTLISIIEKIILK